MAIELFRIPGNPADMPFLVGSRCKACGRASFPARQVCAGCGGTDVEAAELGRRGRVQASTAVYHAPAGFTAPYLLALVEMEEGPLVFCPLTGCAPDEAEAPAGTPVALAFGPAQPGGRPTIQYRPVREENGHGNPR